MKDKEVNQLEQLRNQIENSNSYREMTEDQ